MVCVKTIFTSVSMNDCYLDNTSHSSEALDDKVGSSTRNTKSKEELVNFLAAGAVFQNVLISTDQRVCKHS